MKLGADKEYTRKEKQGSYTKLLNTNISYIYVNNTILNSIRNILYNDCSILYEILNVKIKDDREDKLKLIDKHIDKFLFAISSLYFIYVTDKRIEKENEYINLNSKIIQSAVGNHRGPKIIKFLINYGFIEKDNHYIIGQKSIGYRFAPKWLDLFINNNLKFQKKQTNLECRNPYIDEFNEKEYVLSCFDQLTFNYNLAIELKNKYFATLNQEEATKKEKYYNFVIESWANRDFFVKKSKKVGRIFTLLSSTPRILRPAIQILSAGQPQKTFVCDIKSCQPLILTCLYKDFDDERGSYQRMVESGSFYKTILDYLGVSIDDNTKSKYKDLIWKWAFDKRVYKNQEPIDKFFEEKYPKLRNLLIEAKKRISPSEKRPHSKVAIKLQQMESKIMVDSFINYCIKNNKTYLTIHDSFLCLESDIQEFISFITKEFQNQYKLTPNFDIKQLS